MVTHVLFNVKLMTLLTMINLPTYETESYLVSRSFDTTKVKATSYTHLSMTSVMAL